MSDIKTFTFTKEVAAAAGMGGTRRKRKQSKKQPLPEEDFSMSPQTLKAPLVIHKHGGASSIVPPVPIAPRVVSSPLAQPVLAQPVSASTLPDDTTGGAKNIRVELKKKTEIKSVHLRPKTDAQTKKAHTKRRSKVVLGLSSLRKRITRAKHIHRNIKNMPLDKLKEELIKKNLIRPTSKAPESVLRQIARDSRIVATSM